jgi:hypothetical protein
MDSIASAVDYATAGLSVIPIRPDGSKAPPDGFGWKKFQSSFATTAQCRQWESSGFGTGIVGGKVNGGLEVVDIDREELFEPYCSECERLASGLLARLPLIKTPDGYHIYTRSDACEGSQKLAQTRDRHTLIETKGEGGYVLAPGSPPSCHSTKKPYKHVSGPSIAETPTITLEERAVLLKVGRSFNELVDDPLVPPHQSNGRPRQGLYPGDDFNDRGTWEEVLEPHGWVKDHSAGGKVYWRRPGKDRGWSATSGCVSRQGNELFCCFSSNASPLQGASGSSPCTTYSKFSLYAALIHDGDYSAAASELAKKGYGAQKMSPAPKESSDRSNRGEREVDPWPDPLDEAAYTGLAGELVGVIEPHTEADPVAVLLQFLTAFGNLIGRNAFFRAEADQHRANLFICLVGATSKGRKGTSWGQSRRLLESADPDWCENRILAGLSSGEGLIWAVRDPTYKKQPIHEGKGKDKRVVGYEDVLADAGVEDKRLLVQESEFSSVLKVAAREKNTLSAVIRQAWDSGKLAILNKNSPTRATDAHISIVGHITRDELRRQITETDLANGLANRFLWLCVRRSKCLPDGGEFYKVDVRPLVESLQEAAEFASVASEVTRGDEARAIWHQVYPQLSAGKPGLLGAATSRAEAQVMRLAMIYALLDRTHVIGEQHLMAALAIWQYAEQSAGYAFGSALGDPVADEILAELRRRAPEGMTRTDIRDHFARNKRADEINRAIGVLIEAVLIRRETRETEGRSAEVLYATA